MIRMLSSPNQIEVGRICRVETENTMVQGSQPGPKRANFKIWNLDLRLLIEHYLNVRLKLSGFCGFSHMFLSHILDYCGQR